MRLVGSFTSANVAPAVTGTAAYVLNGGALSARSLTGGTKLWSFTGDGSLTTAPIVVNQSVIVGSSTGNVYALDANTGVQRRAAFDVKPGDKLYIAPHQRVHIW